MRMSPTPMSAAIMKPPSRGQTAVQDSPDTDGGAIYCLAECFPDLPTTNSVRSRDVRQSRSGLIAFSLAAKDAELVSLGIGQDEPAAAVLLAKVVQRLRTQGYDAFDLIIAGTVGRFEIEMDAVLHLLALGYLDEQQPRLGVRPDDHALLVPGLVRISRDVVIAQHLL